MSERELGAVIARREFSSAAGPVILELAAPVDVGGNTFCHFRITGLGDDHILRVGGADAIQALQNALTMAASTLYTSGTEITWHGQKDLGLPVTGVIAALVPKAHTETCCHHHD
ncbi:hypothetical protein FHS83_001848 [Rhizomicrobium palustre]|uniref:DUF6968 domain-containing protein n=1 Tax=Rhizomicrobium palustre TaxID=189966 RepID=A0A846N002_9PROT|nr:hypothetical protein [Rhizomicrobium palustre]NIK88530.1 hypothetical protein [Rhizomicrobium palustre]